MACSGSREETSEDLLILRDSTTRSGELHGCAADHCNLGNDVYERARIEWIGLHGAVPPVPNVVALATDQVHFLNGSTENGRLLSISAVEVVTERASYPRESVRWIHLASVVGMRSSPEICAPANPLGGWARQETTQAYHGSEITFTSLVWFPLEGGPETKFKYRSDEIHYEVSSPGSVRSGRLDPRFVDDLSGAERKGTFRAPNRVNFDATGPTLGIGSVGEGSDISLDVTNNDKPQGQAWTFGFTTIVITDCPDPPEEPLPHQHFSHLRMCTRPTACAANPKDCYDHPERYAQIPFTGTLSWYDERVRSLEPRYTTSTSSVFSNKVTWGICCGCGVRPNDPPPGAAPQ
jgi:hypothetical protein